MEIIIKNLIKNKEELKKNYIRINSSETSDYYDGYYCGKIDELKESISDLKTILQHIEFEKGLEHAYE